jgi:hypothetical protein
MRFLTLLLCAFLLFQCKKEADPVPADPKFVPFQKGKTVGTLNEQTYTGDTYCISFGSPNNRKLTLRVSTYEDTTNYDNSSELSFTSVPFKKGTYTTGDSIHCNLSTVRGGDVIEAVYEPDSLYTTPSISIDSISPSGNEVFGTFNAHLRRRFYFYTSSPDSMNFVNCSFRVIVDQK